MAGAADWRAKVDRVLCEEGEELNLHNTSSLGDVGVQEVAEKLRGTSNAVKELYLGWNEIGDKGARSVADLLRSNPPALVKVHLHYNNIGRDGIASLADALSENTTVWELYLRGNKGVDPDPKWGGTEAEAAAGIDSLIAAIDVNMTLKEVHVGAFGFNPHQKTIDAALADQAGRRAGREQFLADLPMTKSARKHD
jgi:Leucine Rich repeat